MARLLLAAVGVVLLTTPPVAIAAGPDVAVEDTSLFLESDREAEKLLEAARKAARRGQWREAIDAYQRVADFEPEAGAQPVVPSLADPSVYLPIQTAAGLELARALDADGLALYREAHDKPARALLNRALPSRDAQQLRAVARRYLPSSWSDEALLALGSVAFRRGDLVGALGAWQRLLAECREPSIAPAAVGVRTWVCLLALGDARAAETLRKQLLERHGAERLALGGRETTVASFLDRPPALPGRRPLDEWPTLGGSASRAAVPRGIGAVGRRQWAFRVPNAVIDEAARRRFERRGLRVPLVLNPTVCDGRLFVANEAAVYALDAASGRLVWMYPDAPEQPRPTALREAVHAVTCADGKAFARLAEAMAAFDAATGRLLWRHDLVEPEAVLRQEPEKEEEPRQKRKKDDDEDEPAKLVTLATPPVAVGGRVLYGLTELRDEARVLLLALDARTGTRLWRTFVCSRTISAFLGLGATPSAPAVDGSTAYFATNLGAVAAIDVATGSIRWLQRYPSFHTHLRQALIERRRRWANNPPIAAGATLFVTPQDSARLLAIEAPSGRVAWTAPRRGARYLAGIADGRAFLVGSTLTALSAATGRRLWAARLPARVEGRPAVSAGTVHIPTPEALLAANAADGALTTSRAWPDGERPGNLVLAAGKAFVVSNDTVFAFGDWSKALPAIEARRKAAPKDPAPLIELGEHEVDCGSFAAAIAHLEEARALGGSPPTNPEAANRIRKALYRACLARGRRGDVAALAKAADLAPNGDLRADALAAAARLYETAGDWHGAVATWQEVIDRAAAARVRLEGTLTVAARALATAEIDRTIGLRGRGAYAAQEARAVRALAAARTGVELEAVAAGFPNSAAAEEAVLRRLAQPDARRLAPDLGALAGGLGAHAASPAARALLARRLAALREPSTLAGAKLAPRWEVHTRIAQRRAELFTLDGLPPGLVYFASSQRSSGSIYHGLECRRAGCGQLVWERQFEGWTRQALLAGGLLVLPELDRLVAIDPASGAQRWEASLSGMPALAPGRDVPPAPFLLRWRTESARVVGLAAAGDAVFAAMAAGKVLALSAKDGSTLWSRQLEDRRLLANGFFAYGGKLWACVGTPAAVCVLDAATGKELAPIELSGLDRRITDRPAFDPTHGRLLVVLGDRAVNAVDLKASSELWATRIAFAVRDIQLSADGAHCYVLPNSFTTNATIVSLDPATGAVRRKRTLRVGSLADAVLTRDALYVAQRDTDRDLVVQALDVDHLGERWRTVPLRLFRASRLAAGNGFIALTGHQLQEPVGVLIDARSGRIAEDKKPQGAVRLSAGVAGDLVCFGSDRGIYAYGPADPGRADQRLAALRGRVAAGHRPSLIPLANALYRRGDEARAIRLLVGALRDEALTDSEYRALKDRLNSLREAQARRAPAVLTTPLLAVRPKIDGAIDEPWRLDCAALLDGPAYVHEIQGRRAATTRWRSPSDLSAVLYTAWDPKSFYFAIDVTDDIQRTYTSESDTWIGDGLIISIDGKNDGGYGYTFSSNDLLLTLALTRKDERREDRDEDSTPKGQYRVRRKVDNSGTVYEVAIPWSYLKIKNPRPGLRFGFNLTVTDDDGDRATKAISWTPGMVLDRRRALMIRGFTPAHFGDVLLTGPRPGEPPPPPDRPEPRPDR